MELLPRSRVVRLARKESCTGMAPERRFLCRSRNSMSVRVAGEEGRAPWKPLRAMLTPTSVVHCQSVAGIAPEN